MSTTKTRTLTIENLNGLYFQFIEKYVSPNLYKSITQISELLRKPSAYEVFKYLEDLMVPTEQLPSPVTSPSSFTPQSNNNTKSPSPTSPTLTVFKNEPPKSAQADFLKVLQQPVSTQKNNSTPGKPKVELRRTLTGVPHLDIIKPLEFKGHKDDQFINNKRVGVGIAEPKAQIGSAKPRSHEVTSLGVIPILGKNSDKFQMEEEPKGKLLKEIAERLSKVFVNNQEKIERYNHTNTNGNKLMNLNYSAKVERTEEGGIRVKEYQFQPKNDYQVRRL